MKNLYLYISLCFAGICLFGCKKYLTEVPESSYSVAGSYKSQSDFEMAVAGTYSTLQSIYPMDIFTLSLRSDDMMMMPGITHATYQNIDKFQETETNPALSTLWSGFWKIINQCNVILGKIDPIEFEDTQMKDHIKGECFILRALSYWSLANHFGGVPLIDKVMTVGETSQIPRSTIEESLEFAIGDYTKAIELLPTDWQPKYKGRATKYAAEGMLARLYMFQSKFTLAEPLLNDIISSGKYLLESDYVQCFTDSRDNGRERVWEVQFTGGQKGEGQSFSSSFIGEAFKDATIMPFSGNNPYPVVTDNLYYSYEAGDKRRNVSILKGWGQTPQKNDTITMFCIKFTHYDNYIPKDKNDWANNIPILRYTDVKLMLAEVLNEQGYVSNGKAFEILNEIRERAGLKKLTGVDLPNKESFKQALIKERRVEFAFEGIRWIDLIRWGIAKNIMNNFFAITSYDGGSNKYVMNDHQSIFPIPFQELSNYNNNSIMWQNPGY